MQWTIQIQALLCRLHYGKYGNRSCLLCSTVCSSWRNVDILPYRYPTSWMQRSIPSHWEQHSRTLQGCIHPEIKTRQASWSIEFDSQTTRGQQDWWDYIWRLLYKWRISLTCRYRTTFLTSLLFRQCYLSSLLVRHLESLGLVLWEVENPIVVEAFCTTTSFPRESCWNGLPIIV